MAGRIRLDPGELVFAMVGDRVVGGTPVLNDEGDTLAFRFVVRSFDGGGRIAQPVEVPGDAYPGGVDGSDVLVVAGAERPSRGHGVLAISTVDVSSRWLVKPQAYDPDRPVRVLAASGSGERFATQLCRAGMESASDCGGLEIRRVSDGTVVRRIHTGGQPIRLLGPDWLVVGEEGVIVVLDLEGRERWSTRDLGTDVSFGLVAPLGGRLLGEVGGFGGSNSLRLVAFDMLTGEAEVIYDPGAVPWRFWPTLSTERSIVIGEDYGPPLVSGIVTAGVLDLDTGAFDADAIYVDLTR